MLTVRIDLNGTEEQPTHGISDIAAALAEQSWEQTAGAKSLDGAADRLLDDEHVHRELEAQVNLLRRGHHDAARHAARLGFALARTAEVADRGWPAWLSAAEAWLLGQGCDPDKHLEHLKGE